MGLRGGGGKWTPPSVSWFSSTPAGIGLNKYINGEHYTPAWGENLETTRFRLMIVFNNTGNKISLLFFLIQLQTLIFDFCN